MCDHPLYALKSLDGSGEKYQIRVISREIARSYEANPHLLLENQEIIQLPCGKCTGCRLTYSRNWAIRCMLEAREWERNYFLTLTYDEEHLPSPRFIIEKETGEVQGLYPFSPLCPDDLKKFMKDLRRYFSYHYGHDNLRFFACGEYGEKYSRPHFHLILFNCPELELCIYKKNFNGDILYNSPVIDSVWKKGYCVLAEVNFDTCAYVARYVMKKHFGKDFKFYEENGLVPEFTRMSRKPGIARKYYDENKEQFYHFDSLNILGKDGKTMKVKPPSYFDRLYDVDSPEDMKRLKELRKEAAKRSKEKVLKKTSLSEEEYNDLCAENRNKAVSKLVRKFV